MTMNIDQIHAEAGQKAIHAALELWGEQFRPLHFEQGAYQRYGYKKRQGQRFGPNARMGWTYHHRKLRRLGHYRPLVYSGESMEASEKYRIRAAVLGNTAHGTLSMFMPAHFFKSPKRVRPRGDEGTWIDKARELTTLLPDELRQMEEAAARAYTDELLRFIEAQFNESSATRRVA
jgi:hypothetical protein